MEEGLFVVLPLEDRPHRQFRIEWVDVALERDPLAKLEADPVCDGLANSDPLAVPLERLQLFRRGIELAVDPEDLFGIHREASEHVLGPLVDVGATEPVERAHCLHPVHCGDLRTVIVGERLGERDAVAGDQPQRRFLCGIAFVQHAVDRQERPDEEHRDHGAEDREHRPSLVPSEVLEDQEDVIAHEQPPNSGKRRNSWRLVPWGRSGLASPNPVGRRPPKAPLGIFSHACLGVAMGLRLSYRLGQGK